MSQTRRSFASIIATASMASAALATGPAALASDVAWPAGIASPGYRVVVSRPPPVVVHQPVVIMQQPRVRGYHPVVLHVTQPQVIYTRAPVFVHDHGHAVPVMLVRDVGRHGYKHKHKHKHKSMYDRHHRYGQQPGYDGNWGHN